MTYLMHVVLCSICTFAVLVALKEATDTLDSMKGGYRSDKDSYLEGVENAEGKLIKQTASGL